LAKEGSLKMRSTHSHGELSPLMVPTTKIAWAHKITKEVYMARKNVVAREDLEDYRKALSENDVDECLYIEVKHGLDGYPPNIVMVGLSAKANGKDMYKALDEALGL
jgi:pyocin large subunit-like protein